MSLSAGNFSYFHLLKGNDELRFWLVGASIFVLWHRGSIGMTKLSTAASTPWVKSTLVRKGNSVSISACNLNYFYIKEQINQLRCRLVWVPFNIGRQVLHARKSKLTAGTRSPAVNVASDINCYGVSVSTCNLIDTLFAQLVDFQWIWLNESYIRRIRLPGMGSRPDPWAFAK